MHCMHGRKHAWVYRLYSENTKVSQKSRSDFFVLKSVIVSLMKLFWKLINILMFVKVLTTCEGFFWGRR